jgi:hypothetical protein
MPSRNRRYRVNAEALNIYDEIQRSHGQVSRLYELEKLKNFGPDDDDPRARSFAATRLADAASVLRDLWYSAYITSESEK